MLFGDLLYAPIYATLGTPAVFVPRGSAQEYQITCIDKTAGVKLMSGGIDLQTEQPAATVMVSDLLAQGLIVEGLDGGTLTLNGGTWTVMTHKSRPTPFGEADGEVWMMLEGASG